MLANVCAWSGSRLSYVEPRREKRLLHAIKRGVDLGALIRQSLVHARERAGCRTAPAGNHLVDLATQSLDQALHPLVRLLNRMGPALHGLLLSAECSGHDGPAPPQDLARAQLARIYPE
jgi:hypothetical protein